MAAGIVGKSGETMTAEARVLRAAAAYFGFATKVTCPAVASSIPATPLISVSDEPFSRRASRASASLESFIGLQRLYATSVARAPTPAKSMRCHKAGEALRIERQGSPDDATPTRRTSEPGVGLRADDACDGFRQSRPAR